MSRREQARASRARLLAAARSVFAEVGYDRATVAEILDRADMARGALYHYFPDGKRALFAAVFDDVNDEFHAQRDAARAADTPRRRLEAGIHAFLAQCTDPAFATIALTDAPRLVPGQEGHGSSFRLLHEQLAIAAERGELATGVDPERAAVALYGAVRAAGDDVAGSPSPGGRLRAARRTADLLVGGLFART